MTIKQQGGVFGRNPTFNDVTVEGDLSVSGTLSNANTAKLDANQTFTGSNNFTENVYIQNSSFPTFSLYNASGERVKLYYDTNTAAAVLGTTVTAPVKFYVNNGEVASFTTSGNLAFPSGKGIDFSATAGTGTSELFDDYEEGTWTPSVSAGAISGTSVTYTGNYTKIGNTVTVWFRAANTAGDIQVSSYAALGTLPFTAASEGTGTVTTEDIDQFSRQGFANVSGTTLFLSACGSATGTVKLFCSVTYKV